MMRALQRRFQQLLQLNNVLCEIADAFRRLVHGHGVFIEVPAEGLLITRQPLDLRSLRRGDIQLWSDGLFRRGQFAKQRRADREKVAAAQALAAEKAAAEAAEKAAAAEAAKAAEAASE